MSTTRSAVTRRKLLQGLSALGGFGAAYAGMHALGLLGGRRAVAQVTAGNAALPTGILAGRRVVVIGAGLAGLCSALRLARAGAAVEVLEATGRTGGRSLTLRHGDRFAEIDWSEATEVRFETVGDVPPNDPRNYFNAGPGRIPYHHTRVLDYCRELGVALEPYIFATGANLMQNDAWNGGKPVQLRRLQHDLRGHLADLLAKARDRDVLDLALDPAETDAFLGMLQQFGQLSAEAAALVYKGAAAAGHPRTGYRVPPSVAGGPGERWETLSLDEVLAADFWRGEMFAELQHNWQGTLLQPVDGMDAIVRAFSSAAIPGGRTVGDLVATGRPIRRLEVVGDPAGDAPAGAGSVVVTAEDGATTSADFVVSTVAPALLARIGGNFMHRAARSALAGLRQIPAFRVGWQARSRFWETEDRIYGGISWTRDLITQIWYPSSGFHRPTGVLVGAYNWGGAALQFQALSRPQRLAAALAGGEKLHPGFREKVFAENGISVAWAKMPYQTGGWTSDTFLAEPQAFERLGSAEFLVPRVLLAGDWYSYYPSWQEGALDSAHAATDRIAEMAAIRK